MDTSLIDSELGSLLSAVSYNSSPSRQGNSTCSWNDQHEETLSLWKLQCLQESSNHFYLACFYSYLYVGISIPAIILPAVCSQLNKLVPFAYTSLVETLLLVATFCSGLLSVLNLGKRAQHHLTVHQALYKTIQEIDVELRKPVTVRQPCDYFLVVVMYRIEGVLADAPGDGCASSIGRVFRCCWKRCYQQRRLPGT